MRNGHRFIAGLLASAIALSAGAAQANQGVIRVHGAHGTATAARGPNGGGVVHARGVHQNEDGSVTRASGGAYRTPSGRTGVRGSSTTVNPDGNASHSGAYSANGPRGSVDSSGSVYRDAEGNWSGGHETTASNAATGNSYAGSTTIDPETGKPVHSGSCYDAGGSTIACPR